VYREGFKILSVQSPLLVQIVDVNMSEFRFARFVKEVQIEHLLLADGRCPVEFCTLRI
jgi:hypothetical protein